MSPTASKVDVLPFSIQLEESMAKKLHKYAETMSRVWNPEAVKKAWEKSFPKYSILDHMRKMGRLRVNHGKASG